MKFLAALLVVGFACILQQSFAVPLEFADDNDDNIQTELGKQLQKEFQDILQKIKEAIEKGKTIREDIIEKLKDLREKMKEARVELNNKSRELLQRLKEKAKHVFDKILERLGLKEKEQEADVAHLDFNLKEVFNKLKKAILDKLDKEKLKAKVEELFGKGSEFADNLLALLKEHGEKGKNKIMDFIDRFLEQKEKRSIADMWEKVKDYFKNLHIEIKEKYLKFGEWVKEKASKALDNTKSKVENLKEIAREFHKHAKDLSKDVAAEALEFLRPYKDDLGSLWEQVKDTAKEVFNRKD